jgi:Zn-dependent protease
MQKSLKFGSVSGIPLQVHVNWFITAALVTWSLAIGYFPQQHPGWDKVDYWLLGTITAMLFFGSVLLHELGHALVALRERVPVKSITLFIFGGVAHIANEPDTPGSEFRIVMAGPLASFLLAGFFMIVSLPSFVPPQVASAAGYLSQVNVVLAVFNLIPGFPLDGGRILRAFLWRLRKDFYQATRWAAHTGLFIAILFVVIGIVFIFSGDIMPGLWLAFIGWYLSVAAQEGYRQSISLPTEILTDSQDGTLLPAPVTPVYARQALVLCGKRFLLAEISENPGKMHFVMPSQFRAGAGKGLPATTSREKRCSLRSNNSWKIESKTSLFNTRSELQG